jgi:hypothetical protein
VATLVWGNESDEQEETSTQVHSGTELDERVWAKGNTRLLTDREISHEAGVRY